MNNPLLIMSSDDLPLFSEIKPYHVIPAITKLIENCRELVDKLLHQNTIYNWDNLCQPLSECEDRLDHVISTVNHLNNVQNNIDFRKEYEIALKMFSEYISWLYQHKKLYKAYNIFRNNSNYINLSYIKQKSIDHILLDFKLSGIHLKNNKKKYYTQISTRLSELSIIYSNNVLDSTMSWSKYIIDPRELVGIPENTLDNAACNARNHGKKEGWLFFLDFPTYLSVMTYSNNIVLRKEMYFAYSTRASDQGSYPTKWDNNPVMLEILKLRYELSKLLGFQSYAEMSLAKKMLTKPNQVLSFLDNLIQKILPQGKEEFCKLIKFAKQKYKVTHLNPWDFYFYSEKQKQHLYHIDDDQLRLYFPEDKVINGLFKIVKKIFGISINERFGVNLWNADVRFFDIYDKNQLCGSFYLDLYVRKDKRSGAWMDVCVNRMVNQNSKVQKPVAYLVCNFNKPIKNKPILFNHNEVITLFHEFGHCLHHILTNIEVKNLSGINSMPWDVVELPSQIMEKWCWEKDSLPLISGHYKSGAPMPQEMIDNIIAGKNFHSALFILRQLELCLFDFYLHMNFDPLNNNINQIFELLHKARKKVTLLPIPKWERFPNTFSHIFAGGYAAGYYSYLWADMLASNVFLRFKKEGIFNTKTGQSFLHDILSSHSAEEPLILIQKFLGYEPTLNAILENYNIK